MANPIIDTLRPAMRDSKRYGTFENSPSKARYTYFVNTSSVLASLNDMGEVGRDILRECAIEMEVSGKQLLEDIVTVACEGADSGGGFPEPFQRHVIRAALNVPFEVLVTTQTINISYDFKYIGDSDDLSKAFHQGAKTAGGDYIWGAYEGEALKQPDPAARYPIWYDIFSGGGDEEDPENPGGSWEETIQQRISIWGNEAPEWTYVQFGQYAYAPTIPAQSMIEDFNSSFNVLCQDILETKIAEMLGIINAYHNSGIGITPIYEKGKLTKGRLKTNNAGIGPSGKARHAGQFYRAKL